MTIDKLTNITDGLKTLVNSTEAFKNVKIGVEKGVTTKDTPFARIVPLSIDSNDSVRASLPFTIYLGIKKSNNPEDDYNELFALLAKVVDTVEHEQLEDGIIMNKSVIFDEDRLDNFKMVAIQFILEDFNVN